MSCSAAGAPGHQDNAYEVLCIANEFSARPEYPPTVVYRDANGRICAHPVAGTDALGATQTTVARLVGQANYPAISSQWQHHNGNLYEVVCIANEFSERPEYPPTVVYRGENGRIWARPASDWARSMTLLSTERCHS